MNQEDMNTIESREELDKLIQRGKEMLGTKSEAITMFNEFMILLNSEKYTRAEMIGILYTAKRFIENTLDNVIEDGGVRVRSDTFMK